MDKTVMNAVASRRTLRTLAVLWVSLVIALTGACAALAMALHVESGGSLWLRTGFGLVLVAVALQCLTAVYGGVDSHVRERLVRDARDGKAQTDELFTMTDMLQSADTYDDATAVLMATSQRLLPGWGVALYIFNNSRDRLDLAGAWDMPGSYLPAESLAPANCWALKRGRRHINDPRSTTLCCSHHASSAGALEIPMMARGTVYGLLMVATDREDSYDALMGVRRIGQALADSMSLALSNIALREKLRTQSLRDPLTGLYNRRYMEDALERYISLAERSGTAVSVMLLDLDNFKLLNDEHGHAKGDAVLRDVAGQLVGGLRPSDIVCRYGGEELLVIMPDCPLDDAATKAEQLRMRIETLSEVHQAAISASFGVATLPETAATLAELVPMADAALFRAKRDGKNRVAPAERRSGRDTGRTDSVRLAVTTRKAPAANA
ncbi:MAG: GGDEF domain-containing protein [Sphingomonadales bacterium]|nr:GGDEF domain-containing protein [Sphingomonadales bacterium]